MKHLILLRHAKSRWVNPELEDRDRPLNKRGTRSAVAIGGWMRDNGWLPDLALVSDARRTRETWDLLDLDTPAEFRGDLYHAPSETLIQAIRGVDPAIKTLLVIGHNPGLGALAHMLVDTPPDNARFDDFPTGSLLIAKIHGKSFDTVGPGAGQVESFLTPHDLTDQ